MLSFISMLFAHGVEDFTHISIGDPGMSAFSGLSSSGEEMEQGLYGLLFKLGTGGIVISIVVLGIMLVASQSSQSVAKVKERFGALLLGSLLIFSVMFITGIALGIGNLLY